MDSKRQSPRGHLKLILLEITNWGNASIVYIVSYLPICLYEQQHNNVTVISIGHRICVKGVDWS